MVMIMERKIENEDKNMKNEAGVYWLINILKISFENFLLTGNERLADEWISSDDVHNIVMCLETSNYKPEP